MTDSTTKSSSPSSFVSEKGVAGRINYAQWDKVASNLDKTIQEEEEKEIQIENAKLGLQSGKYARSQAEADEQIKAQRVKETKQKLNHYQQREEAIVMNITHVFGNVPSSSSSQEEKEVEQEQQQGQQETNHQHIKSDDRPKTIRLTRQDMNAGTRVLRITDTSGSSSLHDTLVLTEDLSHLESKMSSTTNNASQAKSYPDDSENIVKDEDDNNATTTTPRSVFGIIKVFLQNVNNCTIWIKCKIISGTVEMHHCNNVVVKIQGPQATVATIQLDLSQNVRLEFHDAPSGKNPVTPGSSTTTTTEPTMFWGQDKDDRIFHAGVQNMTIALYRDGLLEHECMTDYKRDGAKAIGNATAEEMQFITSCLENRQGSLELVTESVVRTGSTTGQQVRAMTQRELELEHDKRQQATQMAMTKADEMIQIKDKDGNPIVSKKQPQQQKPAVTTTIDGEATSTTGVEDDDDDEDVLQEVMSPQIQDIVNECQQNKTRGNEAFVAGEYGQAILLYSLALDKADELPKDNNNDKSSSSSSSPTSSSSCLLFPRDVIYANRAACFLKLGQPEKAEQDTRSAMIYNPTNVKALFRCGLALHAQKNIIKPCHSLYKQ